MRRIVIDPTGGEKLLWRGWNAVPKSTHQVQGTVVRGGGKRRVQSSVPYAARIRKDNGPEPVMGAFRNRQSCDRRHKGLRGLVC